MRVISSRGAHNEPALQQILISGTHPRTERPYEWHDGDRKGGVEVFAERSPDSLHPISLAAFYSDVVPALERTLAGHGVTIERSGSRSAAARDIDQDSLLAPSTEALQSAMAIIPNGEDVGYDTWILMGHAVKAAIGPEQDTEGLSIFQEWSARWNGGPNDPRVVAERWRGFRAPFAVGWPYIADQARKHGFNDAVYDFDAEAPSPDIANAPNASPMRPLSTTAERLAALTGLPLRVLLIESAKLRGAPLFDQFKKLKEAVIHGDPLTSYFRGTVLEAAERVRRYATSFEQFVIALGAKLASDERWRSQLVADRPLLERAAFLFVADFSSVRALREADSLTPVELTSDEAPQLVKGLIPEESLALFTGEPGGGKTSLAILLGMAVATPPDEEVDQLTQQTRVEPRSFAGRAVAHGRCLYFCSEYSQGIMRRKSKWATAHGDPKWFFVFPTVPPLTDAGRAFDTVMRAVDETARPSAPPVRLIVIDLLRDAFAGDENSSEVVGAAMATADLIRRATGATVLSVHHSPKWNSADARGSSVFVGAQDFRASVSCKAGVISWKVLKRRDGATGEEFSWCFGRDGILRESTGRIAPAEENPESNAAMAARAIQDMAALMERVPQRAFRKHLRDHYPQFANSREGYRISNALDRALARGWLSFDERKKEYSRGPVTPPPPLLEPGTSLEDAS